MKKITVDGRQEIMLEDTDPCYICGAERSKMNFTWNVFHGQVTSSCCGASYQIKDFYIENPSKEEIKYLEMLKGKYISLSIKEKYVEIIKNLYNTSGFVNINDPKFVKEVLRYAKKEENNEL